PPQSTVQPAPLNQRDMAQQQPSQPSATQAPAQTGQPPQPVPPQYVVEEPAPPRPSRSRLASLWSGGRATAGVAAGIAVVGFLLVRGVARVEIFTENLGGFFAVALLYVIGAAVLALAATEVMRLLLLRRTPRPRVFFGWISGILILVLFLLPLITDQPLAERTGLAFVNLITTIAIAVLVGMSAAATDRARPGRVDPSDLT
ncbi:MAG: DUF6069 family protein, partial [Mycobacteriales bacterium]